MIRPQTMFLAVLVFVTTAAAQTTWTGGAGDSDWGDPSNWSAGVPTATTNVVIPAGTSTSPSTAGVVAAAQTVNLQAGASLTLASGSPLNAASTVMIHGTVNGTGTLRMTGGGGLTASQPVPAVEIAATSQVQLVAPLTITGDLLVTSGTTGPGGSGSAAVSVGGDATFSGGTLTYFSTAAIDVAGDVTFNGSACTFCPVFHCAGDWTSDAGLSSSANSLRFDGLSPQTLSAAGMIGDVIVDPGSDLTVIAPLAADALDIDGVLHCNASIDVGAVHVDAAATLDLGGLVNRFGSTFTVTGTLANPGTMVFDDGGTVSSTAPLGDVTVSGINVNLTAPLTISGSLLLTSGTLAPSGTGDIDVGGDATFSGGTLTYFSAATFDVAGDVTFNGTSCSFSPSFRCAGNWTSDSSYFATGFGVTFDGVSPQSISAPGSRFNGVAVAAGAAVTSTTAVHVRLNLVVDGTLTTGGPLDVDSSVTIGAGGTLDLGGLSHTVGGSFMVMGALANVGPIDFDGGGTISVGGQTLDDVTISGVGTKNVVAPASIGGDLSIVGGTLAPSGTGTVSVAGDLTGSGGSVTFFSAAVIDVAGDVTFNGASVLSPPTIRCAGSWTSDSAFDSSYNTVVLDGAGPQAFSAGGSTFNRLQVAPSSVVASSNGLHCRGKLTVDGQLAAGSPCDLDGQLEINGSLLASDTLDVEGACTVASGGTLDLGGLGHAFGGTFDVDGTLANPGQITFDGTGGAVTVAAGNALDDVVVAAATGATRVMTAPLTIGGDLMLVSGSLAVSGAGDVDVAGDATHSGGNLTFFTVALLDVAGNIVFNGASATSPPNIRCHGSWTSDASFDSSYNALELAGAGIQSFTANGSTFNRIDVAATATVTSGGLLHCRAMLTVDGQLTAAGGLDLDAQLLVNGTLGLLAPMDVDGAATVAAAGTLMAGGLTHEFGAGVTLDGVYVHTGVMRLDGTGAVTSSGGSTLPDVVVNTTASVTLAGPLTITGDLDETGAGTLLVGGGGDVAVGGSATLSAGTLSFASGSTLDVVGDVTFNGCAATSPPPIRLGGSWSSDAGFDASLGSVVFAGPGAQSFDHTGSTFNGLLVEAGAVVSSTSALVCRAAVDVDGTLTTSAPMNFASTVQIDGTMSTTSTVDFDGPVMVSAPGNLDLGSGAHTIGSVFDVQGGLVVGSVLEFDGAGTVTVPGTPLPGVLVDATGAVAFSGPMTISGDLDAVAGTLSTTGTGNVLVTGDLDADGVTLASGVPFDVDGDVTLQNVAGGGTLTVRCAGDFRADATYAPVNGTVYLDGSSPTTFGLIGPGVLTVPQMHIQNSRRTPETSLTLLSTGNVLVESTGELALGGNDLDVADGLILVDGALSLDAGERLALGAPAGVSVSSQGSLSMDGAAGNPVRVVGHTGGGYTFEVNGALSAMNFEFHEVGVQGVRIQPSATIAPPPHDFRGGLFDDPTPGPSSVLLDVSQPAGTVFSYLRFENTNGFGTFNARSGFGSVTLRNWSGAFAGPAFESDPQNRLDWGVPDVTSASLALRPLGERIRARFTTTNEVDAVRFDLERAAAAAGPYVLVASFTPQGAGTEYVADDAPLVAGQTYFYRLVEELTHGTTQTFASGTAVPLALTPPPNFLTVGPAGAFADIQSAVDAATDPQSVVFIEGGTYPSFTVDAATVPDLRVLAQPGQVVNVDTSNGPVVIQNLPLGRAAELDGLVIGGASSPSAGVVVSGCAGTVLVTDCDVTGGAGMPGIGVIASTALAVQGCTAAGTPAVEADVGSRAIVGDTLLGSLEIHGASTVTTSGATPGSVVVDPGSTHDALPGTRPRIGVPDLVTLGGSFTVTAEVDPLQLWILFLSTQTRWFDFGSPAVEVGALIDPFNVGITYVSMRHADALGMDSLVLPVSQPAVLLGFKAVFQATTYETTLSRYRWSNAATTNIVP